MNPSQTKAWAERQDAIFAGLMPQDEIWKFHHLCMAQELTCPTNLTIRHRVILACAMDRMDAPHHVAKALEQFEALERSGYWAEGYSYFQYTFAAFRWAFARTDLFDGMREKLYYMEQEYAKLVAPDGTIPLPEVGAETLPHNPVDLPNNIDNDSYICCRWFNNDRSQVTGYLLICVDPGMHEPRRNLHVKPVCGYYALHDRDGWLHRCKRYTGFDVTELPTEDGLLKLLPKGAVLPTWRAVPPKVSVTAGEDWVEIRWKNKWCFDRTRRISWYAGTVRVRDMLNPWTVEVRKWRVG